MSRQKKFCPCGSDLDFNDCCGRYISGDYIPLTAEALMRSRYSAYVTRDENYLRNTWQRTTCPEVLGLENDVSTKWIGLTIRSTSEGTEQDDQGMVEFIARYKINGKAYRLHEKSRFIKEQGKWFYVDGVLET